MSSTWRRRDREDQVGEAQFAVPGAWMNDPSVWEDIYEDNLSKGVPMTEPKPRHKNRHAGAARVICEALAEGPRRASELRELSGLNGYFSQFMRKLRDDGIVVMPKRGTYHLASTTQAPVQTHKDDEQPELEVVEVVEADWLMRLRIIADYEGCSLPDFVQRLLDHYKAVPK